MQYATTKYRLILTVAAMLLATAAHAQQAFCYQNYDDPQVPSLRPNDDDRRVFDAALVRFVEGSASTANDATGIADTLLWNRSQKFHEQPREYARGPSTRIGTFAGPKWDDEEVALWEALVNSALAHANVYHSADPKVSTNAFYAAWEVMMHRRQYIVYGCNS